jgi:hypothetical protein
MVEIGVQTDGEMGTIEIPISRTSASHRLVNTVLNSNFLMCDFIKNLCCV